MWQTILNWSVFLAVLFSPIWGGIVIHNLDERRRRRNGHRDR